MSPKKENKGCGCGSIPVSLIIVLLGLSAWGLTHLNKLKISKLLPDAQPKTMPLLTPAPSQITIVNEPLPPKLPTGKPTAKPQASPFPVALTQQALSPQTAWERKQIRGIYLSRYQITNNASEQTIRERVRYYRSQGINTMIHGVWGNGCTMYLSDVMQQTLGYKSCPNQFREQWLEWLIDEAHKQGMQVHAYFEKGIKIDRNSPIFDLAVSRGWLVPGIDKTYAGIDQYVLDVEIPAVANFFKKIAVEFVQKYPTIDAVQWDDYLGYYAGLPGKIDRTARLTTFVRQMRADIKQANPIVSFDLCHHNPYWGKRYFAADWQRWNIDRVFIQTYNDANFNQEIAYAEKYAGIAISEQQLYRLKALVNNPKIKSVLIFSDSGKPEATAALIQRFTPISR
ncbi:MAG: family 10 glycosylhydrolase [Verrucomicrobia bacterium]|nr:family 10 glycosylhydrolase [Leptolyngbya sp. ES-bin-22]